MLYVDPDPALEREAEESAQQVMKGSALGIQRMADTEVHVQRYAAEAEVDVAAHNESTEVAKQMLTAAGTETVKRLVPNELIAALEVAKQSTQDDFPPELVDTVASEVMDRINQQTELDLQMGSETKAGEGGYV